MTTIAPDRESVLIRSAGEAKIREADRLECKVERDHVGRRTDDAVSTLEKRGISPDTGIHLRQ